MRIARLLAVAVMCTALGCTESGPPPQAVTPPPPPSVKAMLESLAESGEVGSNMMEIQEAAEALKATDAEKGEMVLKGLTEIQGMAGNPDGVKAKAKELAGKL